MSGIPSELATDKLVASAGNKVFNINVVTEDGKTQHEDYPHEIDIAKYPQFSPEKKINIQLQKDVKTDARITRNLAQNSETFSNAQSF